MGVAADHFLFSIIGRKWASPSERKNPENQYMSQKKYSVRLGLSGAFDSSSARALSPSTRTANSKLGLKRPTLRPRYTMYYSIRN